MKRFASDEHRGKTPREIAEQRKSRPSQDTLAEQQSYSYAQAHEDSRRGGMGLTQRRGGR